ncbi:MULTISPECIES: LysR family transcriptional regulator [unclassified Bacillus (in: firmicutes)]|uniref:LysR family transcriptional regulator n=1 Tax=unclassified Bacillus (in: firmicutes) TaxID=185979 RepID=UPI0008EFE911|nr:MULTISPECIES: LysR family transcriptional regulator [unclassified Bacillus (in: firmicutes)]SFI05486.1 DNA-binding transcriptional regulator, LysR family [Bacillus sp. 71mf]SFS79468.1 DNA-binding transcriptional regulator, LysR family [Bacillus sp. 103mf]
MELRHLKTFIIVAESGGFTRAGERLGYTQSTITNHIQSLEEVIGSPLFDRLGKKVVLTEVGEHMLSYAQKILALSNEALESSQMNGKPSGTIRIGANESLMIYRLPVILYEFKKKYPQVHIILQPSESQELHNELKSGKFDFALFTNPEKLGVDIVTRSLVRETIVLVAPPGHPLTKRKIVTPADLEGEMLLLTEPGSYRDLLEKWIKGEGISCSRIHFWSIEAIKQTVMCGLGLSYLPLITVKEEIERGKLIALPWMYSEDFVTTELAYHKSKWLTPAMKKLIEMIEKHAERWRETI